MKKEPTPFRKCEVCGVDIPRTRFRNHQYYLGGVSATLCIGMSPAIRKVYETLSQKRLRRARVQARNIGYTEPCEVEAFLRGQGYGNDAFPKLKKKIPKSR